MKKMMLGLIAAFALTTVAAPAFAAGAINPPKVEKKKGKKGKKDKAPEPAGAPGDATK